MRIVINLCLLLYVGSFSLFAQKITFIPDSLAGKTFTEITEVLDPHFLTMKESDYEFKRYKRWRYAMQSKLDANGYIVVSDRHRIDEHNRLKKGSSHTNMRTGSSCWSPVAPNSAVRDSQLEAGKGRVNVLAIDPDDPNIIYAGTPAGGLWKTTNAGGDFFDDESMPSNWVNLTDDDLPGMGVSGLVIDPTQGTPESRTIYILTGDGDNWSSHGIGVYKSTDGGASWTDTALNTNVDGFAMIQDPSDPNNMLVAATEGIFRTTDAWATFSGPILSSESFTDIEFKPGDPSTVYACSLNSFFVSTDGGASFSPLPSCAFSVDPFATDFERVELAVTPDDEDQIYVVFGGDSDPGGAFHGFYRVSETDNASCESPVEFVLASTTPNILGRTGTSTGGQSWYDLAIIANPEDDREIHVGGIRSWRSTDNGATWTQTSMGGSVGGMSSGIYMHADVHNYLYDELGKLYCANDGGVYVSEEPGSTANVSGGFTNIEWETVSYGLQITEIYNIGAFRNPIEQGIGFGSQDNGTHRAMTDTGLWDRNEKIGYSDGFEVHYDPTDDNRVFMCTQYGRVQFRDLAANTITNITPIPASVLGPGDSGLNFFTNFAVDKEGRVLLGYRELYRWEDGVWTNLSQGSIGFGSVFETVVAPSSSDHIYVRKASVVYRSTNGGDTWIPLPGTSGTQDIEVHPTDPQILWICKRGFSSTFGSRVFRSNDGGMSWADISSSFPLFETTCMAYQNGSENGLYVGTKNGVYYTNDVLQSGIGLNWLDFNVGLPKPWITDLEINYCTDMIYAGSFGRGLWESPVIEDSYSSGLSLTGTPEGSHLYLSDSYINSSESIAEDQRIVYYAGNEIELEQGFSVDADVNTANPALENTFFCAEITGDPCQQLLPLNFKSVELLDNINSQIGGEVMNTTSSVQSDREATKELIALLNDPTLRVLGNVVTGTNRCRLEYDLPTAQNVSIALLHVDGRLVEFTEEGRFHEAGSYSEEISFEGLENGLYLAALYYQDGVSVKRIIKQ